MEIEKPPLLAARSGAWFGVGEHQLHVGEIPGTMRIFVAEPWGNRIELAVAAHDVFT